MPLHKNSPKRYYEENSINQVVVKTHNNFEYFKEPLFCDLLIEEIKVCKELKKFKLFGFSVIYDHLNLLLQPDEKFNISQIMQSVKKEFSRDVNYIIATTTNTIGDIPECHLRGKQYSHQFNKEYKIPNLLSFQNRLIQKYGAKQTIFPKFKWQKSFYCHIIQNERDFANHHTYTVYNFQKHYLPNDWQYTSLNYPDLIDKILF